MPEAIDCQSAGIRSRRTWMQMRIAEVVRRYRKKTGLSQEAFADQIRMHRTQYSFVERGKRDFRLSTLSRVADGLEMTISTILREAEELSLNTGGRPGEWQSCEDRNTP